MKTPFTHNRFFNYIAFFALVSIIFAACSPESRFGAYSGASGPGVNDAASAPASGSNGAASPLPPPPAQANSCGVLPAPYSDSICVGFYRSTGNAQVINYCDCQNGQGTTPPTAGPTPTSNPPVAINPPPAGSSCVDQVVTYTKTLQAVASPGGVNPSGMTIETPNFDYKMNPGEVLSIELPDSSAIQKFPLWQYPDLGLYWGSRDSQGARDISISECRGDFTSSSAQILVPFDSPFSPNGSVSFYFLSPSETVLPRNDFPYFRVRQNGRGRWFINIRHHGCLEGAASIAPSSCTIFWSMG